MTYYNKHGFRVEEYHQPNEETQDYERFFSIEFRNIEPKIHSLKQEGDNDLIESRSKAEKIGKKLAETNPEWVDDLELNKKVSSSLSKQNLEEKK